MIKITSSTDTPEQVTAAMAEKTKEAPAVDPAATPAKADAKAETKDASGASQTEQDKKEALASDDEGFEDEGKDEGESKEQPKKSKGGFQRRIDELTSLRKLAEKERDEARAELDRSRAASKTEPKREEPEAQTELKEPDSDDFPDHKDYVKALVKWERQEEKRQEIEDTSRKSERTRREENVKRFNDSTKEVSERHDDYSNAMGVLEAIEIPRSVVALIYESEDNAELAYQLGKNPEDLKRIAQLSPAQAIREMGRFEAKHVSAPEKKDPEKKEPKITKAPEPINTISTKGSSTTSKSIYEAGQMSQKEYERKRREGKRA